MFMCFFAAHLQQMWDLQQQPNVSCVAVQDLPRAARGERSRLSRPENEIMAPISENMSLSPSCEPLCSFASSSHISLPTDLENYLQLIPSKRHRRRLFHLKNVSAFD